MVRSTTIPGDVEFDLQPDHRLFDPEDLPDINFMGDVEGVGAPDLQYELLHLNNHNSTSSPHAHFFAETDLFRMRDIVSAEEKATAFLENEMRIAEQEKGG
ncbi:unnamed protein product, partial [Amoebophrya sp. A120]|eukprot:GSA120T00014229001.1